MKRLLILIIILGIILTSCMTRTPKSNNSIGIKKEGTKEKVEEYRSIYSGEVSTLNYLITSSFNEFSIATNVVDTLIEYDNYGVIRPALAKDWSVSDDKLVWTFTLREDVHWLKSDGKQYAEVLADDFVAAMEYILDSNNKSLTANIAYGVIKNARQYYNKEIRDFNKVGIKAKGKYILEYTLEEPVPYFLSMLTYGCFFPVNREFLQEVGGRFGTDNSYLLYNGAYILEVFKPQNKRILTKNHKYWDKDNVFIDKLVATYNKEAINLAPEMFLRGEIDAAPIPTFVLNEWMNDPKRKKLVRPNKTSSFIHFYAFNFDPLFSEEYEPENWKLAVNSINFRKALFHAFDRKAAMLTSEPYNPDKRIQNTVTPKNFIDFEGLDYTKIGALGHIVDEDSFNEELAIQYKNIAMEELKNKVKFPVKVLLPYNTGSRDWANRSQVIEQQMERLLGKDFIDIIIDPQPPTGFLQNVRRGGQFAFLECNWGPDYADPETFTDPFLPLGTYNKPYLASEYLDENGESEYINLVEKAKKELVNMEERFVLFAEAEAFLINNALIIPYGAGGGGYIASRLNPFMSSYSPFGLSVAKFKGQKILEEPMNSEEYEKEFSIWERRRLESLIQSQ